MARPRQVTKRAQVGIALVAGSIIAMAVVGVSALAQTADVAVPRGPFINFCPTTEQIEAHLVEYGFDYKPTVACGEDGKELEPSDEESPVNEEELFAAEKKALLTATRAPDTDGDPLTMEIVYADGTRAIIFIQSNDPKRFEGLTPAEYAEMVYP